MAKKKEDKKEVVKEIKIKITASNLPGKYLLPYKEGNIVTLERKQAEELIEAGDAEKV